VTGLPPILIALAAALTPWAAASAGVTGADIVGHDGFDRIESVTDLRALEARIREVADRARP
jgi:hypothetical protein